MFEVRNSIHILIVFYIVICLAIWYLKPPSMFNDKEVKSFGIGKDKTLRASFRHVFITLRNSHGNFNNKEKIMSLLEKVYGKKYFDNYGW